MLSFILLILKIIGIILLIILAVFLLIAGLLLFVPVRYRAEGGKRDALTASADITWLFRLVQIHAQYQDKRFTYYVRTAWKKLIESDEPSSDETQEIKAEEDVQEEVPEVKPEEETLEEAPEVNLQEEIQEVVPEEKTDEKASEVSEKEIAQQEKPRKETIKEEKPKKESVNPIEKLRKQAASVKGKIDSVKKKIDVYQRFLTNRITKAAIRHLKKEVFYLLRHYLPRSITGDISIGFEDPSQTGKILGYLTAVNALMRQPLDIKVDFEQKILEGYLNVKGHIRACHLVKAALALLLDRNVIRTYKRIRKLKGN